MRICDVPLVAHGAGADAFRRSIVHDYSDRRTGKRFASLTSVGKTSHSAESQDNSSPRVTNATLAWVAPVRFHRHSGFVLLAAR